MEDRHHLKPARTTHSVVKDAPNEKHSHHHKRAMIFMGVVMSMIVILALYAASFRYRELVPMNAGDLSRWGVVQEEFMDDSKSILDGFREIGGTVTGVLNATKVREESIDILKEKISASATATDEVSSATSTPPIEDTPENAPTEN